MARMPPSPCKSLVPLTREEARLDPLLGCTIRKIFGSQWYYGQVIAIDSDVASGDRAYHIAYEDGDEEHLSGLEVRRFLVARSAPHSEAGSPRVSVAPRVSLAPRVSVGSAPGAAAPRSERPVANLGVYSAAAVAVAILGVAFAVLPQREAALEVREPFAGHEVRVLPPDFEIVTEEEPAEIAPAWREPQKSHEAVLPQREAPEVETVLQASTMPMPNFDVTAGHEAPRARREEASEIPLAWREEPEPQVEQAADSSPEMMLAERGDAAEEELAAAAAALVEASGLVARVAAKTLYRTVDEAFRSLLSGCWSLLSLFGSEGDDRPKIPEPEEAGSVLESLMSSSLLACAGVVTILVSIRAPREMSSFESQAKAMASPRMMQMAASPAAPFPSPHTVPMPTIVEASRQAVAACNTPARARSTQQLAQPTPGRTFMSLVGRTPQGSAALPVAPLPVASKKDRRLPPPPVSLVGPEQMQMPKITPKMSAQIPIHMPARAEGQECARCGSLMAADANFCRHCGQQKGKKFKAAMPHGEPSRKATSRGKSIHTVRA
ncbi:unnamed protein product [Effrenium voratum]|uniref:PTM/DIR17-like Tudor domain-containing protein n=1 Tax=Effrenium voratum TaxID=2562239 RepID=A0AA36NAH7_9DINO|nr:unnamed protein product [Effrenium voratum]CAJ1414297.1 unnamed protein product [Effrenium voratum]